MKGNKNMGGKVYVLTAVYNDLERTKSFLKSIKNQDYENIVIYIVDDGSTDGTGKYLKKYHPEIKVLKGNGSLWWTGSLYWGVEEILKTAKMSEFILTINNDCVVKSDFVSNLVKIASKYPRSVVGSVALDLEGNLIDAGVKVNWKFCSFLSLLDEAKKNIRSGIDVITNADVLSTRGTLFPISVFREVGNFDKKNFPHYLSDYEFTYRCKLKGFRLLVSTNARLVNDAKRTGIDGKIPESFGLFGFWKLLFSRKSKVNILDHYKFVKLHCPLRYKPVNYFIIFIKVLYYLFGVPLFVFTLSFSRKDQKIAEDEK